jgi:hypothetical protein
LLCNRESGWVEAFALLRDLGAVFVFGLVFVLDFFALVAIVIPPFPAPPYVAREPASWQADDICSDRSAPPGTLPDLRS